MGTEVIEKSKSQRRSVWSSLVSSFIVLAVFLLLAYGIDWLVKPSFSPFWLLITGIIMALIPAAAWIYFFYRQDQREPEPKGMVLQVFVLGSLLAAAVGIPLLDKVFTVSSWVYSNLVTHLLGGILVIGFTQEFLKLIAVRFSVYDSPEFDERTDGVIYATAAGLGYATILNIAFIVNSGGVDLGMGAIRVVLTALAQASFAGITGYFLSSEKLDKRPVWWLPLGLVIAAVLNGLFFYLYGTLTRPVISLAGGQVNPWWGLILAVVVAAATAGALSWLIQRDQSRKVVEG